MVEQKLPLGALWVIYGARLKRLQVRTSRAAVWIEFKKRLYFHKILFLFFWIQLFSHEHFLSISWF